MSTDITFSDYTQCELVAATNDSQTTLLVSDPTTPFPIFQSGELYFYLTIIDQASFQINQVPPTQREIVKVTAYSVVSTGYSLTVERGITTTPQIWAVGSVVELRPCAQALLDLKDSGGTVVQATYVLMSANATLLNERVLTAGSNITITDGGAGSTVTIAATGGTGATGATGAAGATGATGTGATGATGATGSAAGGATLQSVEFTADDTWDVPVDVTSVWLTMIGGGGGGVSRVSTSGGGGGGGGEFCEKLPIFCVSEDVLVISVGAGGAGGTAGAAGNTGGTTSVNSNGVSYYAVGGTSGSGATNGAGGGSRGASTSGAMGTQETNCYFGGAAGGQGGASAGSSGSGNAGYPTGAVGGAVSGGHGGGGGGANSPYGLGGAGGAGDADGNNGIGYGSGGGGAGGKGSGSQDGGDGADGYVLIQWIS